MPFGDAMAKLIADEVQAGQSVVTKMGTVISRETATARAIVSFDGSSGLGQPVKCFETAVVDVGDRVGLVKFEGEWVIVGSYTARTWGDVMRGVQYTSTTTMTSATYVDMPSSPSVSIVKARDVTQFQVFVAMGCYCSAVNTGLGIGVYIASSDGTVGLDQTVFQRAYSTASTHQDWSGGITTALTLPAGGYTVTARWQRRFGTGTFTASVDNGVTIHVKEVTA